MKYKIEDNIDFFAELKSSLQKDNMNEDKKSCIDGENQIQNVKLDTKDEELCLISHTPLEYNTITLTCKHRFNYLPLYNEVIKQKTTNFLETTHLGIGEIKCPYCRTITNKLLPLVKYPSVVPIRGVNYPEKYCMKLHSCSWLFTHGTKKGTVCGAGATDGDIGTYCNRHIRLYQKKDRRPSFTFRYRS